MTMPDYQETLARFGLRKLDSGLVDLTLTASGDLAITRDGDLQMGDASVNAMFRLVGRWRATDRASRILFTQIGEAENLASALSLDAEQQLARNKARLFYQEQIAAAKEVAATFAGAVFVTLAARRT